jgi:hypothetical protein
MRQVVSCYVYTTQRICAYVWHGEQPLAIWDLVMVRNPIAAQRHTIPTVAAVVVELDPDYSGYLVIIESKLGNIV